MYGDCLQKVYAGRMWTGVGIIHVMLNGFFRVGYISI
jgi:hypothetical protein